jgi:hypothetical protein
MDDIEKIVQQILAQMNTNADADRKERKAYQEKMAADQEDLLARMEAIFDNNQKKAEED